MAQAQKARGENARRLLEDQTLAAAFAALEADAIAEWRRSAPPDADKRESCFRRLRALDDIKAALVRFVEHGKVAAAELETTSTRKT